MGAAAAKVDGQGVANVWVGRRRVVVEKTGGGDDHAGDAIATLRGLLIEKGVLQRVEFVVAAQPFEGDDLIADRVTDGQGAGRYRFPIHQYFARPALRETAAEFRRVEVEVVA